MIKLIRCDDRLIHGQCVVRVIRDFGITEIAVDDDFVASSPVLSNIFMLAAPEGIKVKIRSGADTLAALPELIGSGENVLLLMKSPETAVPLFEGCGELKKELNIGPLSSRKGARKVTLYAHLTEGEAAAARRLAELGVRVYFNQVLGQPVEEWPDVEKIYNKQGE